MLMTRGFLSQADFDRLSSKPRTTIQQWTSLEIGAVYRVLDYIEIPGRESTYAVVETEKGEIVKVWITPIIHKELKKYNLTHGSVFLKPLGKKLSESSGNEYYNFSVIDTSTFWIIFSNVK